MKNILFILLVWGIVGCSGMMKYDGEIVRSASGKYYLLEHNMGRTYFIRELDSAQVSQFHNPHSPIKP